MNDDQNFNFDDMPEPNFDTGWLDSKKLPPQDDKSALPDWLSSAPLLEDEPQSSANATPLPDWLDQGESEDFGSTFVEEPAQPKPDLLSTEALPDWLSSSDEPAAEEPNFDFEEPPLLMDEEPEIEEKPAPSLGLKRLSQTTPAVQPPEPAPRPASKPPEPPPPPQPQIRKLGQKRESQSLSPDEMTFDEWERQQHQKEYEQTHAEDIAMTEAVPDWFVDNVEIGTADKDIASLVLDLEEEEAPYIPEVPPPTTTGSLTNYVPDWFMGLEEQNLENAPEWARTVGTDDLSFETLVDASAFAPPEPEPTPEPELPTAPTFDDDVPDWFRGVAAPSAETGETDDWMAALDSALAASAETQMPTMSEAEAEQPDWFEQAAEESPEAMPTFVETPAPTDFEPSFGEPDWFPIEDSAEAMPTFVEMPVPSDQEAGFEPSFEEPDWLADVTPIGIPEAEQSAPIEELFAAETAPEEDFFATMMGAEAGTFAEMVQAGEEDFTWEEAPASLFGEGGAATNLFTKPVVQDDSPDWLREYETPDELPALEVPEEPTVLLPRESEEAAPEWLEDISGVDFTGASDLFTDVSSSKSAAFSDKELKAVSSGTSIDDLLGLSEESHLPEVAGPKGLVPVRGKSSTEELMTSDLFEGIDDELFKALDEASPKAPPKTTTGESEAVKEAVVADRPEWIADLRPDVPVTLSAGGISIAFEQQRISDLPDALRRLREKSVDVLKTETATAAQMTDSGPLAGVTGGLGIAPQATAPGELNLVTQLTVTDYQAERVALLEGILELTEQRRRALGLDEDEELEVAAAPAKKRQRTRPHFDRFLISIILLVALIGPFLSDALHVAEEADSGGFTVRQYAMPQAINGIQPGQYVLMAFEYGPTAAGELNPLAEAVLRDILGHRGIPIILSTNPLGAINARGVVEDLADDPALLDAVERDEPLQPREDYFVLRYVSGGAIGIRGLTRNEQVGATIFATDADGEETGLEFDTLDTTDFALVIVIGERVDDLRNWAEQFNVPGLPKYALMTAGAEPLATAYVDDTGYQGYLAGYRDTYRYNQLRNTRTREAFEAPNDLDIPDPEISQWHSMALGAMVASALIGLGVVFNLLRGLRRRRG